MQANKEFDGLMHWHPKEMLSGESSWKLVSGRP